MYIIYNYFASSARAALMLAINFLAVSKKAVACYKQEFLKFFSADQNLNIDADEFQYRENNLYAHVYDNKVKGVYVCAAPLG